MVKIRFILKDAPYFILNEALQKSAEGSRGGCAASTAHVRLRQTKFDEIKPRIRVPWGLRGSTPYGLLGQSPDKRLCIKMSDLSMIRLIKQDVHRGRVLNLHLPRWTE